MGFWDKGSWFGKGGKGRDGSDRPPSSGPETRTTPREQPDADRERKRREMFVVAVTVFYDQMRSKNVEESLTRTREIIGLNLEDLYDREDERRRALDAIMVYVKQRAGIPGIPRIQGEDEHSGRLEREREGFTAERVAHARELPPPPPLPQPPPTERTSRSPLADAESVDLFADEDEAVLYEDALPPESVEELFDPDEPFGDATSALDTQDTTVLSAADFAETKEEKRIRKKGEHERAIQLDGERGTVYEEQRLNELQPYEFDHYIVGLITGGHYSVARAFRDRYASKVDRDAVNYLLKEHGQRISEDQIVE